MTDKDREEGIDLGRVIERVQVIHEIVQEVKQEHGREIKKLHEQYNELKNNDNEQKIYQKQIFEKLNKIELLFESKTRNKKEIVLFVLGGIITIISGAFAAYYGTLAALHH